MFFLRRWQKYKKNKHMKSLKALTKNWHHQFSPVSLIKGKRPGPKLQGREVCSAHNKAMIMMHFWKTQRTWANQSTTIYLLGYISHPSNMKTFPFPTEDTQKSHLIMVSGWAFRTSRSTCGPNVNWTYELKRQIIGPSLPPHPYNIQWHNRDGIITINISI